MKIVAIDFETANSSLASVCSLGIAAYQDGELLNNYEFLIKPHRRFLYFTNTSIHGISREDILDEEEFVHYYEELAEVFKDAVLVAHNASFDIAVLNNVCDLYGLDHFQNEYLDTVKISRRVFPELYNHKLNTVAEYLCIDLKHHNACSDSFACLMILLKSMELYGTEDLNEFLKRVDIKAKKNI